MNFKIFFLFIHIILSSCGVKDLPKFENDHSVETYMQRYQKPDVENDKKKNAKKESNKSTNSSATKK